MAGRTHKKHVRLYAGGYDLSGYAMDVGPLAEEFDAPQAAAFTDPVFTSVLGLPNLRLGTLNGLFDNTATNGLHVLHGAPGGKFVVSVPIGIGAAPAAGDPVFCGEWRQMTYLAKAGNDVLPAQIDWSEYAADASVRSYSHAWGWHLHAKAAETANNNGTGIDDNGASSALGGFGVLQVFAGNGTATFSVEAAAANNDAAFDAAGALLTFDTTDCSTPFAEAKALAKTAAVARYLRWQITLGSATSVTFAMSFVRGR
jgi:hypothetical protein